MDIIGRTIANRYEIISKTGVGGMATVYVARDKVLNRDVAVKVLKDEFTTDDEFVKRFNSEAQAAASLTHANIVSIYDVGNEDGIYYIVMELVRGKTLKQIINEEGAAIHFNCLTAKDSSGTGLKLSNTYVFIPFAFKHNAVNSLNSLDICLES